MAEFNINEGTLNDTIAVGTTSIPISSQKSEQHPRKVIILRNTSPNATDIITVNFGGTLAVANKGIVLRQYESCSDTQDGGYKPYQGTITAICATATGQLSIFERND